MQEFLSYIVWNPEPEIFKIGSFGLRYYSICWLLAFIASYYFMLKVFVKEQKSQELLDKLTIYIFVGTLIGARLGHCLFYDFAYYKDHILEIFIPFQKDQSGNWHMTGFTGLASHGGALGILIATWLFSKKTKTNFMWLADRLVLVVPIAGAFIRIGNFFNSEIIGNPTNLPWAVVFSSEDNIPRHPAQLYEAGAYLIIFLILWFLYQKNQQRIAGRIFGLFLVLLFGARFIIEYVKIDQVAFEEGMLMNMGQLLSIPFILVGIFLLLRKSSKTKSK